MFIPVFLSNEGLHSLKAELCPFSISCSKSQKSNSHDVAVLLVQKLLKKTDIAFFAITHIFQHVVFYCSVYHPVLLTCQPLLDSSPLLPLKKLASKLKRCVMHYERPWSEHNINVSRLKHGRCQLGSSIPQGWKRVMKVWVTSRVAKIFKLARVTSRLFWSIMCRAQVIKFQSKYKSQPTKLSRGRVICCKHKCRRVAWAMLTV